jgi:predicted lipoprotein with Yx(FWY)xxD motif
MRRAIAVSMSAAGLAVLAAGCTSSATASSSPASSPSSSTSSSSAPAAGTATLKATGSADGQILVDGSGRTLYLFQADTGSTSTCNGACAVAWPPDTTTGTPNSTGLTASLVGTSIRADHATQVTYKGHPLYYFADDSKPGDVNGQGVTAFGGKWYVVSPSGNAITTAPTTPTPAPTQSTGGGGYGY